MFKRKNLLFWLNVDGAAMLELALILPFLLTLACGIFEFGTFFYQYQLVESGVRDAARYMARVTDVNNFTCGTGGTSQCLTPCEPIVLASKVLNAKDIAVMGVIGGSTKRVSWWTQGNVTVDYTTVIANPMIGGYPTYRGPTTGIRIIKVSTTASYPGVGFLSFLGLGAALTLHLDHQERCIGQG